MRITIKHFLLGTCLFFSLWATASGSKIRLLTPKDNMVFITPALSFSWTPGAVPGNYQVQVSTTSNFSTLVFDSVTSQASLQTVLPSAGSFYCRVRIKTTGYASEWSPTVAFSVFDPQTAGSLLFWYDAQNGTPAEGNPVSTWNDRSSNANNATQSDPAKRPLIASGGDLLMNKKVVRFDGADDFMSFTRLTNIRAMFFLLKHRTGSPSNLGPIMGDGSTYNFHAGDGVSLLNNAFASPFILNGKAYVNKAAEIPAGLKYYNKYTILDLVTTGDVIANYITNDRNINRVWDGDYAEIIMYSDTLNPDKRGKLEDYLRSKYAPPVAMRDSFVNGNLCDQVTLNAPLNYASVKWHNGSTASSIQVTANGEYSLTTTDVFGLQSTDVFLVSPYKRFNGMAVYLCQGDTLKVNLPLPVGYTVQWSTGSTSKNINITTAGQYVVRVNDAGSCSTLDTLNVIIDNPSLSPQPNLAGNLSMCLDEKLFVTTVTAFDSIRWSTGTSQNFISINTPGTYTIYAQTSTGCVLRDTVAITIAGQAPTADFVTGNLCEKSPATFTDISVPPVGNTVTAWLWGFGDGTFSTSATPTNAYVNTGTYTASLKVTTNVGCSDSIVKTVTIRNKPRADFYNLLSCSGNATTFVDNSIANSDSILSWSWNFNGLGTSTDRNAKFFFPTAASYNTLLQVTNSYGCTDTTTRQTQVNPSPVANFKADSACAGTNTIFTNQSTVPAPFLITNYLWEYGDESQSIQTSQPHLYPAYGEYNVRLSVRASNQCVDTVEKTVRVFALPDVDFSLSNTQCTGKNIQFNDQSTTPDGSSLNSWQWFFAGQGTSTAQDPSFMFNSQGNYTIQLIARTTAGCSGSQFRSIAVTSPPVVNFSFTPNYGQPPLNVSYTNLSPTGGNYIWDYGDGSPTYQGFTPPPHTYTVRGTYPIKLLATDFKGCSDSLVRDILVDNAVVDGVMVTVNVVPNGDFYKVVVTVLNNSNIEVTSLGITIRLANGSEVRETWTGSLKPGNTVIYPFVGQLRYNASGDVPVICATIESVNVNAVENDLSNNTTCEEITVGQFNVLTVYPNPATDNVNFGVMLPENGEVEITLYDMLGKLLYAYTYNGVTGYNNLSLPVLPLNGSLYIAEIKYNEELIRRKVMRTDRGN